MCGIGGIYTAPGNNLPLTPLGSLWAALEDRGGHAAGVGWLYEDGDKVLVSKGVGEASDLIRAGALKQVGSITRFAMLHTRYTTHGSVHNNGNNHPVVAQGIVLTHNGVVSNHTEVFRELGCTRRHQVDTESINAALRAGGPEAVYDLVQGSWSLAWVDVRESRETLNLMTNGRNPLVIGRTVDGDVVWASNLYHLDAFDLQSSFNAQPYKVYTITEDAVIRSRFVEGAPQDTYPTVLGRRSHAAAWGSVGSPTTVDESVPSRGTHRTAKGGSSTHRRSKSTHNTQSKATTKTLEDSGWVFSESTGSWHHPIYSNTP